LGVLGEGSHDRKREMEKISRKKKRLQERCQLKSKSGEGRHETKDRSKA